MYLYLQLLILFVISILTAPIALADPFPQKPIIIGCDPDFPPYEFVTRKGTPDGLNIELSLAIAEVMGVEIEFRYAPWSELRHQLKTGQIDVLSGVLFTKARKNEFDFAPPHAQVFQSLWAQKGSSIQSLNDLNGQPVLLVKDGVMHQYLTKKSDSDIKSVTVDSLEDALRLLSINKYDAALGGTLSGEYLLGRLQVNNLKTVGTPLSSEEYGFAVKKGNKEILALLTEGLALLKQSGQYKKIYNKWLGLLPEQQGISQSRVIKIGGLILGPLLLILILVLLWTWTLRRQVRLRTAALKLEVTERERAMNELKHHQKQLIQADKLSSLGVLVSGVAHEINNPNALFLFNLPQLQRAWVDIAPILEDRYIERGHFTIGRLPYTQMRDEIPEMLTEMQDSGGRIKRIVDDLKNFSRRDDSAEMTEIDLNQVARSVLRLVGNPIKKATDSFHLKLEEPLPLIIGNSQRLEQVVINLLINACQALEGHHQAITLKSGYSTDQVWLQVEDQGKGILPEHISKLSDPFFTTRREDGGTGLGLSVSSSIVREHNGQLDFSTTSEAGTIAKLTLPRKG
jgi:signal transduction histidine kinase